MRTRSYGIDLSLVGAVVGFVLSVIVSALLWGLAMRIDRDEGAARWMGCTCLLRMAALLVLTFGLGAGFMIGRSLGIR